jgi:serine/threonine-protein kinase
MKDGARVPVAQAIPILQGILGGLGAAHALGIVHRDLKPDNVFLTREAGGKFVVKLLDFGIAKVMDAAGGMGSRTRSGILLGTPGYMSPEQAKNARDADPRSDLWGAGVLFYEMLTGRPAFPAPTEYARLAALLSVEPEPIEQVDPALTPLASFLRRALKKNKDERFASAIDMSRALSSSAPTAASRVDAPLAPAIATAPAAAHVALPNTSPYTAPSPVATPPAEAAVRLPGAMTILSSDGGGLLQPTSRGTLASPPAPMVVDPPAQVILVPPRAFGDTLESRPPNNAASSGGVAPIIVGILVACALTAGLLLGWVLSRTL